MTLTVIKIMCGAACGLGIAWAWNASDKIKMGLIGAPSIETCFLVGVPALVLGALAIAL